AMCVLLLVPNAIWSRMTLKGEKGKEDTRVTLYETAIKNVDHYLFTGVGAGNYFNKWGYEHGFGTTKRDNPSQPIVYVVHNAFLQVLIYWGLIGLVALLAVIWQA